VQQVEDIAMGVVEGKLVGRLTEVTGVLPEVVDVDLDGAVGAVTEL
jgi:hypothetical protein